MTTVKRNINKPIAAPTAYLKLEINSFFKLPSSYSFIMSQIAMHEYIGILWEKVKNFSI